jgi:hypothetical protein
MESKSKLVKLKSVRNGASKRRLGYEIEIEIGEE